MEEKSGVYVGGRIQRITDHCYVAPEGVCPPDANPCCVYENCGEPEFKHEWTVGASCSNPELRIQ